MYLLVLIPDEAHGKPDFTDFPAPEMEPESAPPFPSSHVAIWQHHPGNIHQSFAAPRHSAAPCYVLIQVPNPIGFNQQMICTRLATTRNKFIYKSACSVRKTFSKQALLNELF